MEVGFLAIGDEILQGKIVDANGPWLTGFLRPWNLRPGLMLTVGDDPAAIKACLDLLFSRCQLVVCSGGLGPTPDDLTKPVLGDYFGRPIAASPEARACAEEHYRRFGRELPEGHGYGYLPDGFRPLQNPSGFAPGLFYAEGNRQVLAAPGVPKEFRDMLAAHFPELEGVRGLPPVRLLSFRTHGVAEEKIFTGLCPGLWDKLAALGKVSSLPHPLGVDVGLVLTGSPADAERAEKRAMEEVMGSALAPHVWHIGPESLEEVIISEMRAKGARFALAESCTGGLCSHRLTNVPGASAAFWGGVVSYDNSVKRSALGVREETLAAHGAVSEECAREMVEGIRKATGVDLAVSVTGIAGPGGGSEAKPVGTLWIGMADKKGIRAEKHFFRGDREALKFRFSQMALYTLLKAARDY